MWRIIPLSHSLESHVLDLWTAAYEPTSSCLRPTVSVSRHALTMLVVTEAWWDVERYGRWEYRFSPSAKQRSSLGNVCIPALVGIFSSKE